MTHYMYRERTASDKENVPEKVQCESANYVEYVKVATNSTDCINCDRSLLATSAPSNLMINASTLLQADLSNSAENSTSETHVNNSVTKTRTHSVIEPSTFYTEATVELDNEMVSDEECTCSIDNHTYIEMPLIDDHCKRLSAGGITLYEELEDLTEETYDALDPLPPLRRHSDSIPPLPPLPPPKGYSRRSSTIALENLSHCIEQVLSEVQSENAIKPCKSQKATLTWLQPIKSVKRILSREGSFKSSQRSTIEEAAKITPGSTSPSLQKRLDSMQTLKKDVTVLMSNNSVATYPQENEKCQTFVLCLSQQNPHNDKESSHTNSLLTPHKNCICDYQQQSTNSKRKSTYNNECIKSPSNLPAAEGEKTACRKESISKNQQKGLPSPCAFQNNLETEEENIYIDMSGLNSKKYKTDL